MPAMLKGYVDRVWGPGVAFVYDGEDGHLVPNLGHIRLFGVVTSYGSPQWVVRIFAGDAGRTVMMRGLRPMCARDARCFYLAHYGMDSSTPQTRQTFLERVQARVAKI
jgi:putative NADPH-quinone reductase